MDKMKNCPPRRGNEPFAVSPYKSLFKNQRVFALTDFRTLFADFHFTLSKRSKKSAKSVRKMVTPLSDS